MPPITYNKIHSFSSEDSQFPASNIKSDNNSTNKWKCKEPGEKLAFIIIQLDRLYKISGIDIGNENSAFIEVLVKKSASTNDEFQQILLASTFMTSTDSKNSTNTNRVRFYTKNVLIEPVCNETYDLIKIICTQPFNKHVKYGLSFIKLHTPVEMVNEEIVKPSKKDSLNLGKFRMREDSDSDNSSSGTLFSKWKKTKDSSVTKQIEPVLNAAAAIRLASSPASLKTGSSHFLNKNKITTKESQKKHIPDSNSDNEKMESDKGKLNRNHDNLLYDKDDIEPNDKLDKIIASDKNRIDKEKQSFIDKKLSKKIEIGKTMEKTTTPTKTEKASSKKFNDFLNISSDDVAAAGPSTPSTPTVVSNKQNKRQPSPTVQNTSFKKAKRVEKEIVYKPFNKLLEGVVLVVSGIQNPERGELRRKTIELGGKYKPDWDKYCTHLICAFKNTPKYNQVLGHGKIITKEWITKCYSSKKRLPWRRYALERKETDKPESEDEILDIKMKEEDSDDSIEVISTKLPIKVVSVLSSDPDTEDEIEKIQNSKKIVKLSISSETECDTEEEIEKIQKKSNNSYDKSTDEDEANRSFKKQISEDDSSNFFMKKIFYLHESLSSVDVIKLKRLINIYKGDTIDVAAKADYILSSSALPQSSNSKGIVLRPLWVYECHEMECLIPIDRYKV